MSIGTELSESVSGKSITLSQRELEVLNLILEGNSSKQVANSLYCTKRTVDFHLSNAYKKLQVSNRIQALRRMVGMGLVGDLDNGIGTSV